MPEIEEGRLLASYVISIVVGHLFAWGSVKVMFWLARNRLNFDERTESLGWLVGIVGVVERAIATTLMVFAPRLVPGFVGAWVLLKFAGGWGRYKDPTITNRAIYMIALLGNAVSFATAIGAGLFALGWSFEAISPWAANTGGS